MSREIYPSSPKMLAKKANKYGFDWENLQIGGSWKISPQEITFSNLQSRASKAGKELGCVFKVINHDENIYEVSRISNEPRKYKKRKNVAEKQQESKLITNWSQIKTLDK